MKMLAGIVLYNPDLKRLRENINAILPQVPQLLLVDNGSSNIKDILEEYQSREKINFICLNNNLGIAAAQNKICIYAKDNGFNWAITLDQDSVVPENLISEYKKYASDESIGIICPRIIDRNAGEINYNRIVSNIEDISQCIASASAIRLSAWEKTGGFYEPLFIDSVDFDMCWSLKELGYRIIRANNVSLLHEVGHSKLVHFAGKDRMILNHSPLRYYYIIRNSIIVGRRHKRLLKNLKASARIIYQVNRYENNILQKNKMILTGLFHGIIGKAGKYGK